MKQIFEQEISILSNSFFTLHIINKLNDNTFYLTALSRSGRLISDTEN